MRYIVKWNGVGYACHDTVIDWNISVHQTEAQAQAEVNRRNNLASTDRSKHA